MSTAIVAPSRELEHRVLELQRSGLPFDDIADKLGLTVKRVGQIIRRANARFSVLDEDYIDMRRREVLARNSEMINTIYEMAIGKKPRTVMTDTGPIQVTAPDHQAMRLVRDLDKDLRDILGIDRKAEKDAVGQAKVTVNYVNQTLPGQESGPPSHTIEVQYEVSGPTQQCLPEPDPQNENQK